MNAKESKSEKIQIVGLVEELLPNAMFRVRLEDGRELLAHLSGKMKMYHIHVLAGDRVLVEVTEYDKNRGRIVRRL